MGGEGRWEGMGKRKTVLHITTASCQTTMLMYEGRGEEEAGRGTHTETHSSMQPYKKLVCITPITYYILLLN